MANELTLICYRFQCARYLTCKRSGGTGCCLEQPPHREEIPDGACTKEKGYPYYQPGREEKPVHTWMRRH